MFMLQVSVKCFFPLLNFKSFIISYKIKETESETVCGHKKQVDRFITHNVVGKYTDDLHTSVI